MNARKLPPGQHEIDHLLRWNIDHPGIIPENPKVDLEHWTLTVDGEVKKPLKLTWQDLLNLPAVESKGAFHCVEGWSVRDLRWYGVRFGSLVELVEPDEDAKYVFFKCLDGYTTSLNLEDLVRDDVLLAYKLNGKPLEVPLGGPLRLVVPHKYAYKSAMWIERISFAKTKELGFWEKRGYSDTADVWKNDRFTG
jgi:DMSO/TMAO reductase YedYZ molybdopterin-dependent catalytic subunit